MKVYIVRHGETENNKKGVWTGWNDIPLTQKGEEDAARLGKLLKDIPFDAVFASDLQRACKTAEIAIPNCDYKTNEKLREINVGNVSGKPFNAMTDEERALVRKEGYVIFGGESQKDFFARVTEFLKELETLECENVAVFCHGGWLRRVLLKVLGVEFLQNVVLKNCATLVLEYENSVWKLHSLINIS